MKNNVKDNNIKEVDARGLSCPQPVIMLKKALADQPKTCRIIVDNPIAKENVSRFGAQAGYQLAVEEAADDYILTFSHKS